MSRIGLITNSNGYFQHQIDTLAGVKSLSVEFWKNDDKQEACSGLLVLFHLLEQLKKLPQSQNVLKYVSIAWKRPMKYEWRELWFKVFCQISELPSYPIVLLEDAPLIYYHPTLPIQQGEDNVIRANLKNISKLYFITPRTSLLYEVIPLGMVKNSCIVDLGTAHRNAHHWSCQLFADNFTDHVDISRPVDTVVFATTLREAPNLRELVDQFPVTSHFPEYAFEIRYNRDILRNFNAVLHLLYCNWKFPNKNHTPWAHVPRDLLHYIFTFLHPMQWKEAEADKSRKRLTVRAPSWAKAVLDQYTQVKTASHNLYNAEKHNMRNQRADKEIESRMLYLEKELQLCRDKLAALPIQLQESAAQVITAQQEYEAALDALQEGALRAPFNPKGALCAPLNPKGALCAPLNPRQNKRAKREKE